MILLPRTPELLGLQVFTTMPGSSCHVLKNMKRYIISEFTQKIPFAEIKACETLMNLLDVEIVLGHGEMGRVTISTLATGEKAKTHLPWHGNK